MESRSGAVRRRRAIAGAAPFGMTVPEYLSLTAVSTPRSSNRTGGFPAFGFRTRLAQDYAHGKLHVQLPRERRSNLPSLSPATSSGASEPAREVVGVPPLSVLAPSDVSLELRPLPSLGLSPSSQVVWTYPTPTWSRFGPSQGSGRSARGQPELPASWASRVDASSFARMPLAPNTPAALPQCTYCSPSQGDNGPFAFSLTSSASALPLSRLCSAFTFLRACLLADPLPGPFPPEASTAGVTTSSRSECFRLEQ